MAQKECKSRKTGKGALKAIFWAQHGHSNYKLTVKPEWSESSRVASFTDELSAIDWFRVKWNNFLQLGSHWCASSVHALVTQMALVKLNGSQGHKSGKGTWAVGSMDSMEVKTKSVCFPFFWLISFLLLGPDM